MFDESGRLSYGSTTVSFAPWILLVEAIMMLVVIMTSTSSMMMTDYEDRDFYDEFYDDVLSWLHDCRRCLPVDGRQGRQHCLRHEAFTSMIILITTFFITFLIKIIDHRLLHHLFDQNHSISVLFPV